MISIWVQLPVMQTEMEPVNARVDPTRRRVMAKWIACLAGGMAALLGTPFAIYLFDVRPKRREADWVDAGEFLPGEDYPRELTFRRNRVDGWKIYSSLETAWLNKTSSGQLVSFSPWCTHLGCAYHWEAASSEFICPCHGSRFDKDGNVLSGPAARPLDRLSVTVSGNRVWLGQTSPQKS